MSICCAQKRRNQKSPFVICLVTNIVALVFNAIVSPSTYPSQSVSLQSLQICFLTSTTGFVDHSHLLCMPVRRPRKKSFLLCTNYPLPPPPPPPTFSLLFCAPQRVKINVGMRPTSPATHYLGNLFTFYKVSKSIWAGGPRNLDNAQNKVCFFSLMSSLTYNYRPSIYDFSKVSNIYSDKNTMSIPTCSF